MKFKNMQEKFQDFDRNDVLGAFGLQSRPSAAERLVPALAVFGAGILVGAGLGLMLAPKPGRELREDLRGKYRELEASAQKGIARANHAVAEAVG